MSPTISIIIATYNAAEVLPRALQSVAALHCQDWECLVVDGASTDGTLRVVEDFEARDDRFRHLSEPDEGTYDAFNKGWRMARGEWVYFLGADDVLLPDGLSQLVALARPEVDVLSGTIEVLKTDGTIVILPSGGWEGCHQAKLTRRSALQTMQGFDGRRYPISADLDCYVRMRMSGRRIADAETAPIARFSMGGQSQRLTNSGRILREYLAIFAQDASIAHPVLKSCRTVLHMILSNLYRRLRQQRQ